MNSFSKKTLAVVGAGGIVFGLAAWDFYFRVLSGVNGGDWMVYYSAIRTVLEGHPHLLYDGTRFTAALNVRFASWLAEPYKLHPWLYPPHFLLLLWPFGLLSAATSLAAFVLTSFALAAAALWALTDRPHERALYILSALLNPAAAIVVRLGQDTFLTLALLVGGFVLTKKRPVLAGVLFGVLTYKPQFCLMVPVALIASRQWKALAATAASAGILVLVSLLTFGPGPWEDWLRLMVAPTHMFNEWQTGARDSGMNLFACARLLGASAPFANAIQLVGAILAALAVWRCFSRPFSNELRVAVLLAATAFAAPHIMNYDAVLIGVAATLFLAHNLRNHAHRGETVLAAILWLCPLMNPPSVFFIGIMTPILIALFASRILDHRPSPYTPMAGEGAGA
ncbi:MAG: DUF2029 domain-containing protein [Alphaproteobacteria bacterium]|nr:DUF2029 domain-containing protein [Alphaproteobacteria bacterium]MDE1986252.1 DUF2029 domain-containing protein [Alphaproteobacteria bacterium]MDE2162686.1 DUF2029 domain-containing protein [Alphaproteobacteria bacterium]MDE2265116.1 DUF2029 domain-containing protein [Alphaproteobacteria bacterium]MDE2500815.1 DUF2029 domain-containing protein [Alphaproteobacteria bacterium]